MAVLNIMSLIIDKMTGNIEQINAESLCQYLPLLWDESNDHNMLRCAILSTLVSSIIHKNTTFLVFSSFFLKLNFFWTKLHLFF